MFHIYQLLPFLYTAKTSLKDFGCFVCPNSRNSKTLCLVTMRDEQRELLRMEYDIGATLTGPQWKRV
jgi:hypothetical protein